jgi:HAE1 family hydrophobic/amphiphilic exporter-1
LQRLAELCVRRPVLSTVITLAMVLLGVFSFLHLNLSRYPDVELPIITVITRFPGASAEEVEADVTRRIEGAVSGVDGINTVTSTSEPGVSIVQAQFVLEKSVVAAGQEVRDRIGTIADLPPGADTPQIFHFDLNQIPVAVLALSASRPVREISEYAARVIRPQLEGSLGVAQVSLAGEQLRQVNVVVDPFRLAARGIPVTAVLNALTPGRVDVAAQRFVPHTFSRLADLGAIPVRGPGGRLVRLGDVARIEDGAARVQTTAKVNETPAVLLYVQKQPGTNTVRVVRHLRDRLRALDAALPAGYTLRVAWDQSEYVLASTHAVEEHLLLGSILAALVVLVFLWDWRSTVITALAIPISLVSTFTLLAVLHLTLNTFTLLALALVIGIVIDDAIVVLENIYRCIHERGMSPFRAAIDGTREVGPAVMATTVSLIVVFLPLAFMSGIVGRFMSSFGWTMTFAIAVSLLVSFTLTPSLASRWLGRAASRPAGTRDEDGAARMEGVLERGYRWLLERSLRARWAVLGLSALTMASIVPLAANVNQNFLPMDDESQFEVVVQTGGASTLAATSDLGDRIAADIRRLPGVAYTIMSAGTDAQRNYWGANRVTIFVRMLPVETRAVSQAQAMALVRRQVLSRYESADVLGEVNSVTDIAGTGAPLQYVISGPNLAVLDRAARAATAYLRTVPGVVDIRSSASGGSAFDVKINPAHAAARGVDAGEAANALALLSTGLDAPQVQYAQAGQFYPVQVRATISALDDPLAPLAVPLLTSAGGTVPLEQVIDVAPSAGASQIQHFNRARQVTISANLLPDASLGGVVARLDARMRALGLPADYHLGLTGISEQVSQTKAAFAQAFSMAFLFMFLVLAAQFESWLDPVTILVSLPLTVPFALISILLLHGSLNPLSYLGILVLFGVVKKNAILQVDRANRLRVQGLDPRTAIVQASVDRLRPILMTTIAFVAGMIPLAVSRGVGAATAQSISTAIIGGQMLSLLLTLVAIPVVYTLFAGGEKRRVMPWLAGQKRERRRIAQEGPVP